MKFSMFDVGLSFRNTQAVEVDEIEGNLRLRGRDRTHWTTKIVQ